MSPREIVYHIENNQDYIDTIFSNSCNRCKKEIQQQFKNIEGKELRPMILCTTELFIQLSEFDSKIFSSIRGYKN